MTTLNSGVTAQRGGFFNDLFALSRRALWSLTRDVEAILPAFIIPIFFYAVNVGSLQDFAEQVPGLDYKAFQIPVAALFAVTGLSRANVLVLDIQRGYFDRLSITPSNRLALLLGLMVADGVIAGFLSILVIVMGLILGVSFETGILGILLFIVINLAWAIAYNAIPYGIALKTGNPTVVNTSFLIFFPVIFLAPLFLPREVLTGWLQVVAAYNPVTYLLEGLRSIISGWDAVKIGGAFAAVFGFSAVTIPFALWALAGRTRRA